MKISKILFPKLFLSEVVFHNNAGYLESRAKILIGNGRESVETHFDFSKFEIDLSELVLNEEQCPTVSNLISSKIHDKNTEYREKFFDIIKGLQTDFQISSRVTRVAPIVVPILTAVGSTVASESISLFFNIAKKNNHSKRLNAIEREIESLEDSLRGSICHFSSQSITNRLILIDKKFHDYTERVKADVENLIFNRKLSLETKIRGCLTVNKLLSAEICLEMAKSREFKFSVVSIEEKDEGFSIRIILEVDRIVEFAAGNRYEPIGIPRIENDERFLVYPYLPSFVSDTGEKWSFKGPISHLPIQVWPERLINRNLGEVKDYDVDCIAQNTTDETCDGFYERVYSDFNLVTLDRQQILSTFVKCTFKAENKPKVFLEMGIHHLNDGIGTLACGSRALHLNHHKILPIQVRTDTNSFKDLNRISKLTLSNIPIYDPDNPINQVPVFGQVKLYTVIMAVLAVTLIIIAVSVKLTLSYFALKYRSLKSIASRPY